MDEHGPDALKVGRLVVAQHEERHEEEAQQDGDEQPARGGLEKVRIEIRTPVGQTACLVYPFEERWKEVADDGAEVERQEARQSGEVLRLDWELVVYALDVWEGGIREDDDKYTVSKVRCPAAVQDMAQSPMKRL